jgi:hypothetical protein
MADQAEVKRQTDQVDKAANKGRQPTPGEKRSKDIRDTNNK